MQELILYLFKSSICLGVFFAIYHFGLRSTTFFRFNRIYLIAGLIASFVLPLFKYTYDVKISFLSISNQIPSTEGGMLAEPSYLEMLKSNIWLILALIYGLGLAVILMRSIFNIYKLLKIRKESNLITTAPYKVYSGVSINSPFSILNSIYLPDNNVCDTEKDIILKHEITHIKQKHWIDLLCGECALMLQWFNPLVRIYMRDLKENHEFLADKAVIRQGVSTAVYKAVLINQSFQGQVFSFSNSLNYPNKLNRLTMMNKTKSSPYKKMVILLLIPFLGLFLKAFAEPNYIIESDPFLKDDKIAIEVSDSTKKVITLDKAGDKITVQALANDTVLKNTKIFVNGKEALNGEVKGIVAQGKTNVIKVELDDKTKSKAIVNLISTDEPKDNSETPAVLSNSSPKVGAKGNLGSVENPPLVVVDGKEYNFSEINNIAPDNIESITVLKDKSATAVYGDKGKNGVIQIITKK